MEDKKVEQLLEKYWRCETTPEEEQLLQKFFLENTVPEKLKPYKTLFSWKMKQQKIKGNEKWMKFPERSLLSSFYPVLRIAASVLVILTVAIAAYTHYQQEKLMDKIFSDTYINLEDTVKETKDVMAKVQLVPGKNIPAKILDSLEYEQELFVNDSLK